MCAIPQDKDDQKIRCGQSSFTTLNKVLFLQLHKESLNYIWVQPRHNTYAIKDLCEWPKPTWVSFCPEKFYSGLWHLYLNFSALMHVNLNECMDACFIGSVPSSNTSTRPQSMHIKISHRWYISPVSDSGNPAACVLRDAVPVCDSLRHYSQPPAVTQLAT